MSAKRTTLGTLFLAVLVLCSAATAPAQATPVQAAASSVEQTSEKFILRSNLPLVLRNKHPLSSELNHVGDPVEFYVVRPVTSGNTVIIAKDALAKGKITLAEPKRRLGKGGELAVSIDTVEAVNGEQVPLQAVWAEDGGGGKRMAGHIALAGFLLWPAAPLPLLERGKPAEVPTGIRFDASVKADTPLSRTTVETSQPKPSPPRTDVATVYVYRDPQGKDLNYWISFACGEKQLQIYPRVAIGLELPPGDYWFRSGFPARKKLHDVKQQDLLRMTLTGGSTYYLRLEVNTEKRKYILHPVDEVIGDAKVAEAKFFSVMSSQELQRELPKLQAQTTAK